MNDEMNYYEFYESGGSQGKVRNRIFSECLTVNTSSKEVERSFSLPQNFNATSRKLITKYILLRIIQLQLDQNMAKIILESMDDQEFKEEEQNQILQKVLNGLEIAESQLFKATKRKNNNAFQSIQVQFKQLLGTHEPAVFQYLMDEENKQMNEDSYQSQVAMKCGICIEEIVPFFCVQIPGCLHLFCQDCISAYLTEKIMSSNNIMMILCPQGDCKVVLDDRFVQKYIDSILYGKLCQFRKIRLLTEDNNIRWCTRPGCENILKRMNEKEKILYCECGQDICFPCGNSAHPGLSCEKAMDQTYKSAIQNYKIQKCPKCLTPIQKSEGCNHIICQRCDFDFCWLCREKYKSSHYKAYNLFGCPSMENDHRDPFTYPFLYRSMRTFFYILFGIPALLLTLIIGIIVLVFFLPIIVFKLKVKIKMDNACLIYCIDLTLILMGFIISPLTTACILITIALFPIIALIFLFKQE